MTGALRLATRKGVRVSEGKRAKKVRWKWITGKKRVYIEQTKSIVVFTYSPNKCHNIFIKYLFSVVVGHGFIFYYFILTYKILFYYL